MDTIPFVCAPKEISEAPRQEQQEADMPRRLRASYRTPREQRTQTTKPCILDEPTHVSSEPEMTHQCLETNQPTN